MDCSFKVYIYGRGICFSDRELEYKWFLEKIKKYNTLPLIIYGPEGCGKTTLLKYLLYRLDKIDYTTIYINALAENPLDILYVNRVDSSTLIGEVASLMELPFAKLLSTILSKVVEMLWRRFRGFGKGLVIVIDDVYKAIGLENVERYTKLVYEWITWKFPRYHIDNLLIIITTSEGVSKRILSRHSYLRIVMIWNLDFKGYSEFIEQLNKEIDPWRLYRVVGGNPRLTIELMEYNWNIELLKRVYKERIIDVIKSLKISKEKLRLLIEDPDSDSETAYKLEDIGFMIRLLREDMLGEKPSVLKEIGVGREWAWQTPLYRDIVRELVI